MPRTQSAIVSAVRGTPVTRRPRPLPGQKTFTQYPVVDRHDLVGVVFQIVSWELVPKERTQYESESIVMHIKRGTMKNNRFVPDTDADRSVWTGAFIKSQLESMEQSDVEDELFSCRPGTYNRKTGKAVQLGNDQLERYHRGTTVSQQAYAIWIDFWDNFDDDILSESEQEFLDEDEEEIEVEENDDEEVVETPASRNRKMVASNGNARAYKEEKVATPKKAAVNPSRARIKTIGKRAKYNLETELDLIGYMPRGTEEFNQETGEFLHKDGRVYDVDSRKWVIAQ